MNNIKKAGSLYTIGSLFNKGIAFLTVPIFTRILATSDYGIVTTYNSWASILAIVMGFSLHMGIRMAFIDYKDEVNEFLSTMITFTIEFGIVCMAAVIACCKVFDIKIPLFIVVLCLMQGISHAIIEDYSMYLMMRFQYKGRTALMVLPNLISVLLSVIVIMFVIDDRLYMGRIVPTALIGVLFGGMITILSITKSKHIFNKEYLKYGLAISAPLVLHGIALNVLSQSDRTMITWLADSSQTGVYSLIYNFSMLAMVITTSLEGVWAPWFLKKYKEEEFGLINKRSVDYVKFVTVSMVGLILVGPEVVKFLASKPYWEGIVIIPPVVLANYVIFLYTFYVNVEHYNKKTLIISRNTVIAAVVNLVLNFIFIPKFGFIAAAYTTLISYLIALVLHALYAKKLERRLYPISQFARPLVHILFATMAFYFLYDEWIIRWVIVMAYVIVMALINKKQILEFFNRN